MHQFLVSLFAMLMSLCQHTAISRPVQADVLLQNATPTRALSFPDRRELARTLSDSEPSYAGSACLSCQRMNVSFTAR
jgi:hypothetical protein